MLIDLAVVLGFQVPLAIAAVTVDDPTPMRLWLVVAATNLLGAVVYVVNYRRGAYLRRALTSLP